MQHADADGACLPTSQAHQERHGRNGGHYNGNGDQRPAATRCQRQVIGDGHAEPQRTIMATMARPISVLLALLLLLTIHASALAQRPTAAELDKTGWEAIRASKLQEAADAFREGLRLEPRNVRLMLGAAVAANLMGRAEEARQQLVAVLQLQPTLTDA